MRFRRRSNYLERLPVTYSENPQIRNFLVQDQDYTLNEVSFITKTPISKIRKDYNLGLFLLESLVKAYYLLKKHKNDIVKGTREIRNEWRQSQSLLAYIPSLTYRDFVILSKFDPETLWRLKYKRKKENCK